MCNKKHPFYYIYFHKHSNTNMIYPALSYIREALNESFRNEFSITENKVVLSNIINPDGSTVAKIENKIVFFLLNLDEEAALKNNINRHSTHESGGFNKKKPNIYLNLHIIFCANFIGANYTEGLRYLSALIRFFQNKNILKPDFATSNPNDNKLLVELCKLDYSDMSHVWSSIGSKMLPSAVYKIRLLSMEDTTITKVVPAISQPNNQN